MQTAFPTRRLSGALTLAVVVAFGAATVLLVLTRTDGQAAVAVKAQGPVAAPASQRFIVPDDQIAAQTGPAPAGPQVHAEQKNGPRSMSFAAELQQALPASFHVTTASDIDDFDAASIVLEGPAGKLVANEQRLTRPIPLSSVATESFAPSVAPGNATSYPVTAPSYTQRPDGSVVVSSSEPSGAVVAVARPDGSFVRLEALGNLGAPAPLQPPELQTMALHHFGLS